MQLVGGIDIGVDSQPVEVRVADHFVVCVIALTPNLVVTLSLDFLDNLEVGVITFEESVSQVLFISSIILTFIFDSKTMSKLFE